MGLSNFPSAAEGVLPVLVMNTVLSVALLKNMVRSLLHVVGATSSSSSSSSNLDIEDSDGYLEDINSNARKRRISITQFKSLCHDRYSSPCEVASASAGGAACNCSNSSSSSNISSSSSSSSSNNNIAVECCVCLCRFEAEEEVSELSCKHFFHKGCLEKWFHNNHSTCPLCRSIL